MTRRGSLAYYFSALVWGALTSTAFLGFLIADDTLWFLQGKLIVMLFVGALLSSAWILLLFAFVLRWMMRAFHCSRAWQWALAGALLATTGLFGLKMSGLILPPNESYLAPLWRSLPFEGASYLFDHAGIFSGVPIGSATAYVLYLVYRAFEMKPADFPGVSADG